MLPQNFFIFSMFLEPISRLKLDYMSYFRKFWFAGGKGSKVKFCPFLARNPVISGTAPRFFSEILQKVKWSKSKKSEKVKILKKILDLPLGAKMRHFGPKNQYFSKYLKNATSEFFYIQHVFKTNQQAQTWLYVLFLKIFVCRWLGVKGQILPLFGPLLVLHSHISRLTCSTQLKFCLNFYYY